MSDEPKGVDPMCVPRLSYEDLHVISDMIVERARVVVDAVVQDDRQNRAVRRLMAEAVIDTCGLFQEKFQLGKAVDLCQEKPQLGRKESNDDE